MSSSSDKYGIFTFFTIASIVQAVQIYDTPVYRGAKHGSKMTVTRESVVPHNDRPVRYFFNNKYSA